MAYGSAALRRLYDRVPPMLRSILATGYGYRHRRRKYGRHYHRWLALLRQTEFAPVEQVENLRDRLVREFVARAAREVPYWGDRMRSHGIAATDIRTARDLGALPLLDKEEVRSAMPDLWAPWVSGGSVVWFHTSGTTGKALAVPISVECFQREYAFRWLHYGWCGLTPADRVATFAGHPVVPAARRRPPYWVHNWAEHQLLFSSQHLGPREARAVADALMRFRPALIHGYPSAVSLAAVAVRDAGVTVRPRAVYTASETLLDAQAALIASTFACPVMNWYGNTEMVANIVSCPAGSMHIQPLHSVVELLAPDGRDAKPGEPGELICTGFGNAAMPLIRYRTGDVAVRGTAPCGCGRATPTVACVTGRVEDYVVTPGGRLVGRLDHVFKDSLAIREAQIEQVSPELLVLRVVRRPGYDAAVEEPRIAVLLRERLEPSMTWQFEYVEAIPRGPNNKIRFVISRVRTPWAGTGVLSTALRSTNG